MDHLKIALADQKMLGQSEQDDQLRGIEFLQTQKAELEATLKKKVAEIVEYVTEIAELKENATVQNVSCCLPFESVKLVNCVLCWSFRISSNSRRSAWCSLRTARRS